MGTGPDQFFNTDATHIEMVRVRQLRPSLAEADPDKSGHPAPHRAA